MTENLSAIWSGALISWRSSYTVSGIVLKRQTKDKRPQRSKKLCKRDEPTTKKSIYSSIKGAFEFCLSLFTEEYRTLP